MRCLKCNSLSDKVIDSRSSKDGLAIRRRRECLDCGNRYTTYEQVERHDFRVVKRTQIREEFDRAKLLSSLVKSCEKRKVSIETLELATDEIMSELHQSKMREVPTKAIGPLVMSKLKDIDPVAYVRYASVYRRFKDVGEFLEEIESLEQLMPDKSTQPELFS